MAAIVAGALVLTWPGEYESLSVSIVPIFLVLGACLAWALEHEHDEHHRHVHGDGEIPDAHVKHTHMLIVMIRSRMSILIILTHTIGTITDTGRPMR